MAKPYQTSSLVIAGTSVEVSHEIVPLEALRLDPQNPRVRLQLKVKGRKKAPTQEELLELIREQPGYDRLQQQIRMEGGIYDPLIVRNDGQVVEGNTRLAVLTVLSRTPGGLKKWGSVPITRLPAGVSEKVIQLQMAGYTSAVKPNGERPPRPIRSTASYTRNVRVRRRCRPQLAWHPMRSKSTWTRTSTW